jgi:hypothetical protein
MTERELQHWALLWLSAQPDILVWRNNVGFAKDPSTGRAVKFGLPGASDILAVVGPYGRMLGIELKSARGKQSEQQKAFQRAAERAGAVYVLARCQLDVVRGLTLARGIIRAGDHELDFIYGTTFCNCGDYELGSGKRCAVHEAA